MKKRVASLILAVLMVFSALPVFALPVFAEGEAKTGETDRTYTVDDYNALYVQDGLLYAVDFFKSNQYWNFKGEDPADYVQASPAVAAASTALLKKYISLTGSISNPQISANVGANPETEVVEIGWDYESGYIQFFKNRNANAYLELDQFAFAGASTLQFVAKPGSVSTGSLAFVFRGVSVKFAAADNGEYKVIPGRYIMGNNADLVMDGFTDATFPADRIGDFTISSDGLSNASPAVEPFEWTTGKSYNVFVNPETTKTTLRYGTTTLIDNGNVTFTAGTRDLLPKMTHFGYNQSSDMKMYAFRLYSGTISDDAIRQNHFADLAKYFRLSLSYFLALDDAAKTAVYQAVANFTFDSDRDEIQAAVDGVYCDQYASLGDTVSDILLTNARKYHLDYSIFETYPLACLSETVKFLLEENHSGTYEEIVAAYQAAQEADIDAYAALDKKTAADFDSLYVRDGLIVQVDFFSTNQYWDNRSYDYTGSYATRSNYETIGALRYTDASASVTIENGGKVELTEGVMRFPSLVTGGNDVFNLKVGNASSVETTSEYVLKYAAKPGGYAFYTQGRWIYISGAAWSDTEGATLGFEGFYHGQRTYGFSESTGWGTAAWWRKAHGFTAGEVNANRYVAGKRAVTLTTSWNADGYYLVPKEDPGHPMVEMYAVEKDQPLFSVGYANLRPDVFYASADCYTENPAWKEGDPLANKYIPKEGAQQALLVNDIPSATAMVGYQSSLQGDVYAIRQYNRVLSRQESWQNHFADLAKYFRINLGDFGAFMAAKSAEEKEEFYKAFRDLDLATATRFEVQSLYTSLTRGDLHDAPYDALIAEDPAHAAFYAVAKSYALDAAYLRTVVLGSSFDLSYVFANVTKESLLGKSAAEAQQLLENAVSLAKNYYSLIPEGDTATEEFVNAAAAAGLDISALMRLPRSDRADAYATLTTQAAIDAYVAEKMEVYGTGREYTKEDYNALYVTDGLLLAADWFGYNSYWGEALPELPIPPYEWTYGYAFAQTALAGVVDFTGKDDATLIFPNKEDRVLTNEAGETTGATPAYNKALTAYKDAYQQVLSDAVFMKATNAQLYLNLVSVNKNVWNDQDGTQQKAVFTLQNGYIQLTTGASDDTFLSLSPNTTFGMTRTVQQVLRPGATTDDNAFLVTAGISTKMTSAGNGRYQFAWSSYQGHKYNVPETPLVTFSNTAVGDFTTSATHPAALSTGSYLEGSNYSVRYNGQYAIPNTQIQYVATTSGSIQNTIFGYNRSSSAEMYALRYYDRDITNGEIAQNHFADLAKYYRLDLRGYEELSAVEKAGLYTAMADLTVGSEIREQVQAAYNAYMRESFHSKYDAMFTDAAEEEKKIYALALSSDIDPVNFVALPGTARTAVAEKMMEVFSGNVLTTGEIFETILARETEALYPQPTEEKFTQEDYNKLYARQDHMTLWVDFFSATEEMKDAGLAVTGKQNELITTGEFLAENEHSVLRRVFRVGSLEFQNNSYEGTIRGENLGDRAFHDGYFSTKGHACLVQGYGAGIAATATEMLFSDVTYEFVYSDPTISGAESFQLDIRPHVLYTANGGYSTDDWSIQTPRITATKAGDGSYSAVLTNPKSPTSVSSWQSAGYQSVSGADGNSAATLFVRVDKDFSVQPIQYYKVTSKDGKDYSDPGRYSPITESEARALYGESFDDDFAGLEALSPLEARILPCPEATTAYVNNMPVFVVAIRAQGSVQYNWGIEQKVAYASGTPDAYYYNSNMMSLASQSDYNWYSIRRYDVVLTDDEMAQNHFVDLAKFYRLDITHYLELGEAGRRIVHNAMKDITIVSVQAREAGYYDAYEKLALDAYFAAMNEAYYAALKVDGEAAYNHLIDLAGKYGLDLSAFVNRPLAVRLQYANILADVDTVFDYDLNIIRILYKNALNAVQKPAETVEEMAARLISFSGYSARISSSYNADQEQKIGVRSTYVIDEALLADLKALLDAEGKTLEFGARQNNHETPIYKSTEVDPYVGKTFVRGETGEKCFTVAVTYEDATYESHHATGIAYGWYVKLGDTTYTFDCDSALFGKSVSAEAIYRYFFEKGKPSEIEDSLIKKAVTSLGYGTAGMTVNGVGKNPVDIRNFKIVYDETYYDAAEAQAVAEAIEAKTGIRLPVLESGALITSTKMDYTIWLAMPQQVSNLNVPDSYAMYMQQDHQSQMSLWILQRDVTAGGAGLGEAFAAYLNTLVPEDGVYRFVVQNYPTSIVSKTPEA